MATRLPSGSYRSQVLIGTENGKRIYKSFTAETADAADLLALQYKASHRENLTTRSFAKVADEFLKMNTATLSPTTLRSYGGILRGIRANYKRFAETGISEIDRVDVQTVLNHLAASHSPKTVSNYFGFISSVLKANGIRPPEVTLPKKRKPELNIPDMETLRLLFEAVKGTELEVPVLLGALVPMREGEIFGTDISDLSEDDVLHIHHSLARGDNGELHLKQPKTYASDRYVKLPPELAKKIRDQGYICHLSYKTFSTRFSEALARAGLPHFRFHDLRHAFVSIAHAAGIPDAAIMARGGWSTSYTMTNVYRHLLDSDREKMEAAVNGVFSDLISHQ